jgi:glucosylceramidase
MGSSEPGMDVSYVDFQNPDRSVVLVVVNSHTDARHVSVKQGALGFRYTMPGRSVATFVWNPGGT